MYGSKYLAHTLLVSTALAAPFDGFLSAPIIRRQTSATPRALPRDEQNIYTPFAHFASAAYCSKTSIDNWSCGSDCKGDNSPDFQTYKTGGDLSLPYYIGYDKRDLTLSGSTNTAGGTVVLSYQGTNSPTAALRLVAVEQTNLTANGPNLFKTVPAGVTVHSGFLELHASTASEVLTAVMGALRRHNSKKVLVTGHSLGAAIAVIAATSLKQNLPDITVSTVGFASPRIGNRNFATFAGNTVPIVRHINNKMDFVPVIPGRTPEDLNGSPLQAFITGQRAYRDGNNYSGVKGEIHIVQNGTWFGCGPTLDNTSELCSTGTVTTVEGALITQLVAILNGFFPSSVPDTVRTIEAPLPIGFDALLGPDHNGPYNTVSMGRTCDGLRDPPI